MIAKVRIAPVEQWCEFHAKHLKDTRRRGVCMTLVGMQVEIFTETMRMSISPECLGRIWNAPKSTDEKLIAKGCNPAGEGICEHMLEMD